MVSFHLLPAKGLKLPVKVAMHFVQVREPDEMKTSFECRGGQQRKDDFLDRQAVFVNQRMAQEEATWEAWRNYKRPPLSSEALEAWRKYDGNNRHAAAHNGIAGDAALGLPVARVLIEVGSQSVKELGNRFV